MPCFHPRATWTSPRLIRQSTGKPRVVFKRPALWYASEEHIKFYQPEESSVAGCKPKCVGCQEDYSRSWAVRCWHEASMFEDNCFITLTYNDKYLPSNGLVPRHFDLFIKRLRRAVGQPKGVRYYMAGEYGSQFFRPHYHACIFGLDFPDRKFFASRGDCTLYTSEMLSALWSVPLRGSLKDYQSDAVRGESFGFCSVGELTFASAAYVARYVAKKVNGAAAEAHYQGRLKEYVRMSLKPGIGAKWIDSYMDSVYPDDSVTLRDGARCKVPRYYDKRYELHYPDHYATLKSNRKLRASVSPHNTPERLRAREKVKQAQFNQLKRSL